MAPSSSWNTMAHSRYVSLTTFRKSGEPVSTAMWLAADGEAVIFSTHADSGKVKRLKNNSRVQLRPSSASGSVKDGVQPLEGTAELIFDPARRDALSKTIQSKYGWQQRFLGWVERRGGGRSVERVVVRVTPTEG